MTTVGAFDAKTHLNALLRRVLDDRDLALVDLEVDQFRRLLFLSRQFLLHLPPEVQDRSRGVRVLLSRQLQPSACSLPKGFLKVGKPEAVSRPS